MILDENKMIWRFKVFFPGIFFSLEFPGRMYESPVNEGMTEMQCRIDLSSSARQVTSKMQYSKCDWLLSFESNFKL